MELAQVSLNDKYALEEGRIYLTGVQALVRLPLMQAARDRAAGLTTAGFISGYRGSPLGTYDSALWGAKSFLADRNIHFQPGVNEDLGATAVWGSQQVNLFKGAKVDGVFGIWYGKGPGVDRSLDALKHANAAGSSRYGGVLALAGDDHGCQSSTLPHQSEQVFQAAMIPVLNPATVQEYLDFGLLGFAMSRFTGCWIGFKAISEAVESSASIAVDIGRPEIVIPADFEMPADGLNIRYPDPPMAMEARLHGPKMQAVAAFARANGLDRVVFEPDRPARIGIVATGKAYLDLRQALTDLGLRPDRLHELGVRIYKVGMPWPLEADGALRFAEGLTDIIVVEEKRGLIEDQLMKLLYRLPADRRPSICGKTDEGGRILLPSLGELNPAMVARTVAERLQRHDMVDAAMSQRLARIREKEAQAAAPPPKTVRTPFFCSGCPHNTSTKVPEGSRAMAGIGCHGMALWMPDRNTQTITHMGGEGVNWIGQAPFAGDSHVFQNLGDGTYFHSGLLAIRAAAAAGVNITYKILFNDAVAMTGGQHHDGPLTVWDITRQVESEGAKRVVVVTDEPDKYPAGVHWAPKVEIRHRDELDAVQRELRDTPGLTVLVYDQTCAAEKRRRRKRGTFPDPAKRVFINDEVCEGCGDCSVQSNCVSVKPLDTDLGRKRRIDQSDCNKDFSCLKGFCPSFVTVEGAAVKKAGGRPLKLVGADADPFADLPMPARPELQEPYGILVTGIGGTGVITVGALIAMAAHVEGKGATALDFTGLAQKNGAVMSHVRLAPEPEDLHAVRISAGGANLVLGCDAVVAASSGALATMEEGLTRAVVNANVQPTAAFVLDNKVDLGAEEVSKRIRDALARDHADFIDATGLATAIMGDSIAANLFLVGYAWQKGLIPLSLEAITRAIEINGVAVEANMTSLSWGRLAAHDIEAVRRAAAPRMAAAERPEPTLDEVVADRVARLAGYQDAAYADRYRKLVEEVAAAERQKAPGQAGLAMEAARNLYKVMAYKDEYEVARLYTDGAFAAKLDRQFGGDFKLKVHMSPPLISRPDPETGVPPKRAFSGRWIFPAFRLMAKLKGLRGTAFDIFGYTAERKAERRLVEDYAAVLRELAAGLTAERHPLAVQIAAVPEGIRGFGHIKARNLDAARKREAELLALYRKPDSGLQAAE
ncbi:indolepyruvate ferredoxin oxidoreductase family protein [Marinibaculum pumilum]|uniref:Indolepyruvate ferredoxin oxidoreductase family protein n=1 Tax=Marinibaculum pumilum TaxID=1766165 RepID=A0ABV7L1M0_9PROT